MIATQAPNTTIELKCPFTVEAQIYNDFITEGPNGLPRALLGQPLIRMDDVPKLGNFLASEYQCQDLETMAPYLWMLSTQSSASIRPLHRQRLVGRKIVVTESPRLHLVWYYDQVFIKPLPAYLLSHAFWFGYLISEESPLGSRRHDIRRAALGYIRTYRHLIKYESDFEIAQESAARLIPAEISWPQFCAFVSKFDEISDTEVSGRYNYGELRMTRLNFYGMFILHRSEFEYLPAQYATYFNRYFGPLLFAFAAASLELSAMQVEIAVEQTNGGTGSAILPSFRWFSVVVILGGILALILLLGYALYMIAIEWVYALKQRRDNKRKALLSA
ncbi:hypothetical protein Dda_6649 [Drechslerella dactyloides]|uniref:Subtilisin-like serine protease protein n=1 Tax=Drechslerella dactyloides TaxID=74499 RepID=A0AAD6IUH9_DREDA|nr:hypothetical protein Dda_6649 [Drechslerella dactyloides]